MVAGATCLVTRANGTAPDGGVCFLGEFFIIVDAFALGQVQNFGSLSYVADSYGELCLLHEATSVGNEPPTSSPLPGLLGADLEVLAH